MGLCGVLWGCLMGLSYGVRWGSMGLSYMPLLYDALLHSNRNPVLNPVLNPVPNGKGLEHPLNESEKSSLSSCPAVLDLLRDQRLGLG